ncbi:MucBP domain-containing protein, partial [Lactobacillus apis]|uniref:MucBP domain-containing protein n=1 Tax=Lactobacillus apis TaxID=303541 RepID=UPI00242F9DA6
DENGQSIADDETLSGKLDDQYEAEPKDITDYVLVETPDNAKGTFSNVSQEVTYVYSKKTVSNVTVHYRDETGKSIADDKVLSGKLDDQYEAEPKDITDYVLVETPDNVKGTFSTTPQEVTYVYTKKTVSNVIVHYQDEAGNTIADDETLSGKLDTNYTAKPKDITDYELVKIPDNVKGQFSNAPQEVTFVYTKKAGADVIVHYQDEAGNTIAADETLSGKLDTNYTAKPKDITDYELVKIPDNVKGQFSNAPQEVTFVYTKKAGADVIVHFQDEDGNTIAPDETLSGKLDASYTAKPKDITDYELVKTPMNATGTFGHKTHDVTFVYTKKTVSNVTVHYQDETGKTIADDKILSGKLGDKYTAEPKDITDYELVDQPTNATGTFRHDAQEVTFVYTKTRVNPTPTPSPTPSKDSDTPIAGADVTIYHQNEAGKTLAPKETLKGNLGEGYVSMYKEIAGYILKVRPANATGFFDSVPQSVTYVYSKVKSVGNASIAGKPKKKAKHKNKRKRSVLKTKNKRTHKQSSFKRKK